MNSFKILQKVICLIISILVVASSLGGCQDSKKESSAPESSSSESSSSSKEESASKEKVPMGDFAVKYKDSEMSLDEYKLIMLYQITGSSMLGSIEKDNLNLEEFVRSGSFEGQPAANWIKQNSAKFAKLALVAREKLKALGKDLSPERKMSINSSVDEKYSDFSKICNISLDGIKEYTQDRERISILEKENIHVSNSEAGEVTVNEEVISKIDIFDLAKSAQNWLTEQKLEWN